jgi:uncharacterized protein YuzE
VKFTRYFQAIRSRPGRAMIRVEWIEQTKDLDENTQLDVDSEGRICALTIEHARERADLQHFSFEQVGT